MDITAFDFKFNHEGEIINANCQVSKPFGKEQFRISVMEEDEDALILIMYKTNQSTQPLFWFPVDDKKEALSISVAKALEKKIATNISGI